MLAAPRLLIWQEAVQAVEQACEQALPAWQAGRQVGQLKQAAESSDRPLTVRKWMSRWQRLCMCALCHLSSSTTW